MSLQSHTRSMGVLNLKEGETKFQLARYAPSEDLAGFVKHFWLVSWDLSGQPPYVQDVVPNPCVNLIFESGKTAVYGVAKSKQSQTIQGKGRVFGVKFKPGGFYPFVKWPVSRLTGSPVGIAGIFGAEGGRLEHSILSQDDPGTMVELADAFLRRHLPAPDETVVLINRMIDLISDEDELTKVEQLVDRFGMNKRKLQRLFNQYVGVSPKWVIKLYRIQNAAEAIDGGRQIGFAKLSAELGYYDQSHFIRDFKSIVGKTPDEYMKLH
ncbi:helix-turn-helix domain-containing protein [Paenibacillus beijingensis]|uniref:AraC family transcriptional regulator n=1 Tax=Paenibacillus beijingensis TaxID=1126833 RepID=A0A0D5NIF1_9BACL|nr:helix-turn-helix domain-containing protein [Paenibacillus beijingensis]AJY75139.1 AraC family transcriptional regulator [Paenibacillus beijingensis]